MESPCPVIIRQSTLADIQAIVEIKRQVQGENYKMAPEDFFPDIEIRQTHAMIKEAIEDHNTMLSTAVDREEVAGFCWSRMIHNPASPFRPASRCLYVIEIAVHQSHRRRGIGTYLLSDAVERGRRAGAQEMGLDSWVGNEPAHALFAALGFAPFNISFRHALARQI